MRLAPGMARFSHSSRLPTMALPASKDSPVTFRVGLTTGGPLLR
jgi:hypothetical protein